MREEVLRGHTRRISTGCGNLYITINEDAEGKPWEVFIRLGKAGGCAASQSEALGRLISLALKAGTSMETIIKQLAGIGCHQSNGFGNTKTLSCADAVAQCLAKSRKKQEKSITIIEKKEEKLPEVHKINFDKVIAEVKTAVKKTPKFITEPCPECGSGLIMEEGCAKCYSCGFTRC
jgi:ribonucleoside-diphosphate reductase alpha chain